MQQVRLEILEDAIFRANSAYEVVPFEHLSAEQEGLLGTLQKETDFYGVLLPQADSGLAINTVDLESALLFLALQTPGYIPRQVKSQLGARYHSTIAALVLDKVLEIEWHGTFLSGLEACELLYTQPLSFPATGLLALLSLEAIKYVQSLVIYQSASLSMRLYYYNKLPLTPYWLRTFPTTDAVAEYLGLQPHSAYNLLLKRHWTQYTPASASNGWFVWTASHRQPVHQTLPFVYKLYVSPACAYIRDAFHTAIEVLADEQAIGFKIGKDVSGLLRPDKLVIYFSSMEASQHAADALKHKLAGMPAHGVPFTSEIMESGLLSWGIDPPAEEQLFKGKGGESWRLWVTNRLATALQTARLGQSDRIEPWEFALERLRLDGVDIASWTPPQLSWQASSVLEE